MGASDEQRFLEWARASLAPLSVDAASAGLAPLVRMLGDARVVALTEGTHCAAEPLQIRNGLFQHLAIQNGFTAIAIESGLLESRAVEEYVRSAPGDLDSVLSAGLSWTFDRLPQNRALVQWLKGHNAGCRPEERVHFYGFDVAPSGTVNSEANRTLDTALCRLLTYLAQVDPAAAARFQQRLDLPMQLMRNAWQPRGAHVSGYERLSVAQRDALTAAIADLTALVERKEGSYSAISSGEEYAWAHRAALCARQTDAWLRHLPIGWSPCAEMQDFADSFSFLSAARDVRDRAQADHVNWIVDREDAAGKVLVFGHRYHLSNHPMSLRGPDGTEHTQQVAGTYLKRRLGRRLITMGHLIGHGQLRCAGFEQTLERAPPRTLDALAARVGHPFFCLDLRQAPAAVSALLEREWELAHPPNGRTVPLRAFDVLIYTDTVTPACA